MNRREIENKVGNLSQVFGTRKYQLLEGNNNGTRIIDVNTGSGLEYSIVLDRAMDISNARYKGLNLTHLTLNGEVNPGFYESFGKEWGRIFFGGMVTTCGLTTIGPPGKDGEDILGLHGRISAAPARNICDLSGWNKNKYSIEVRGIIEETVQMGYKLRLKRKIKSEAMKPVIRIEDEVENIGSKQSPFSILYHINFGYPLLDEMTQVIINSEYIKPFDQYSESKQADMWKISEPILEYKEENYLCKGLIDKNGYINAAIINEKMEGGIAVYIKASANTLPYFCYWKMLDMKDYVVAIEPSNSICENRTVLRENNMLEILNPGDKKKMIVEIGVIEGIPKIRRLRNKLIGKQR